MKKEKSSGAVIFRLENKKPLYLLLYGPTYWGFPKGLVEKNETEEDTTRRETKEETGIDIKIIPGFKERIKYMYRFKDELISKEVVFFVAETKQKDIRLSKEHEDFKWLSYDEALNLIKFKNQKELLKKAHEFILNLLKKQNEKK